jgi:hypothetical protein
MRWYPEAMAAEVRNFAASASRTSGCGSIRPIPRRSAGADRFAREVVPLIEHAEPG